MLFQNRSFEVCSNKTLSEKYCEKRAEAVKRVLMCTEASMPLHCHINSLTPSTVTFSSNCKITASPRLLRSTVNGFYLNNPDTLFGYSHLVIRLTNLIPVPTKNVCVNKSIQFSEKDLLHHVGSVGSTKF